MLGAEPPVRQRLHLTRERDKRPSCVPVERCGPSCDESGYITAAAIDVAFIGLGPPINKGVAGVFRIMHAFVD